jgi:hypothetical protein
VTRQSPNLLKDLHETLGAASSSGLRAVVGSAEEKEKIEMMRKFPSSDSQASEPAASEAKGSSEEERKRKVDAVFAELAAHGIDRSQSRWGRKNVVPTDAFRPVAITPVTAEVPTTPELRRYCGASTWATPTLTEIPYTPGLRREIDPEDEPDEEQRELTEAEVVLATEIITRLGGPVAVHGTQAALADLMGRLVEHFGCPEAATVAITQGNIILTAQHVLH